MITSSSRNKYRINQYLPQHQLLRSPGRAYLESTFVTNGADEIFDVVDHRDYVVEQRTRSEVHRLRLLHRAVHVFLFRSDGTMLIHRRTDSKEEFPSVWTSSCSGHVSAGESYDETAPRELFEELGITSTLTPLRKVEACEDTSFEFTVLYQAFSDAPIKPDPEEIADVRWLRIPEISEWVLKSPQDFSPAFRLLFSWFLHLNSHKR